jgi:hypothetical protein
VEGCGIGLKLLRREINESKWKKETKKKKKSKRTKERRCLIE